MKDGNQVTIRPIRPEDEPLMVKFHETLSDRSVYLRYFCSLSLSRRVEHERLLRICFGDYDREMALVAERTDPDTGVSRIVAVGRMNKLHARNEAEVAALVSDRYQNHGLGNELLRRVIQIPRDEKLSRVSAEMLTDIIAMQVITKRFAEIFRALRLSLIEYCAMTAPQVDRLETSLLLISLIRHTRRSRQCEASGCCFLTAIAPSATICEECDELS
jgi:acetyltransferase